MTDSAADTSSVALKSESSATGEAGQCEAPKKKRGFHPALILVVIGVVLLVAYGALPLFMWARISQNEAYAREQLALYHHAREGDVAAADALSIDIADTPDDVTVDHDYLFVRVKNNPEEILAAPVYPGKTATEYLLLEADGKILQLVSAPGKP